MNENTALMERKAAAIHRHDHEGTPLPRGVKKHMANSAQRTVYIDKRNGWVFKIQRWRDANVDEFTAYNKVKDMDLASINPAFADVRFPITLMLPDNVIVMEYIKGEHPTYTEWGDVGIQWALERETGINDLHNNNVIRAGKFWFVVDMGFLIK